jgi:malonyl CoA-acyl carrier protein transacylase
MFPGQGSQAKGMGKSVFEYFPDQCDSASKLLGHDIVDLCLNDGNNQLNQTYYTQPALYFVSALTFLSENDKPNYLLGHSLGLYTALFASGVFSLEEGLAIVLKRAELMAEANNGSMMAVIGDDITQFEDELIKLEFYDIDIANYNSDHQIVLSGSHARLTELQPFLEELSYKAILLPVSGAFHSRYMRPASAAFLEYLSKKTFNDFQLQVISSTNGEILTMSHLIEELAYQLISPVRWRHIVSNLKKKWQPIEFKEIGPGTVLSTLNKQIV